MDNNYVRQLEAENKHLREALAKPYELLTKPTIVIDDPSGYIKQLQDDYAALVQAARELIAYRKQAGAINFQLEKADSYLHNLAARLPSEPTPDL